MKEDISQDVGEARYALGDMLRAWRENLTASQDVSVTCSTQMPHEALSALSAASALINEQVWHAGSGGGGLAADRRGAGRAPLRSSSAGSLASAGPGLSD